MACGKLPVPICPCERCGRGIKATRGWQWIKPAVVLQDAGSPQREPCRRYGIANRPCERCPLYSGAMNRGLDRAGLLWAGETFYPTPGHWMREATDLGASRRIKTLPKGFVLGQTWVWMAHRKAIEQYVMDTRPGHDTGPRHLPGVFHLFRPTRAEVVVEDDVEDDEVEQYLVRGLTPVRIEHRKNWAHRGLMESYES